MIYGLSLLTFSHIRCTHLTPQIESSIKHYLNGKFNNLAATNIKFSLKEGLVVDSLCIRDRDKNINVGPVKIRLNWWKLFLGKISIKSWSVINSTIMWDMGKNTFTLQEQDISCIMQNMSFDNCSMYVLIDGQRYFLKNFCNHAGKDISFSVEYPKVDFSFDADGNVDIFVKEEVGITKIRKILSSFKAVQIFSEALQNIKGYAKGRIHYNFREKIGTFSLMIKKPNIRGIKGAQLLLDGAIAKDKLIVDKILYTANCLSIGGNLKLTSIGDIWKVEHNLDVHGKAQSFLRLAKNFIPLKILKGIIKHAHLKGSFIYKDGFIDWNDTEVEAVLIEVYNHLAQSGMTGQLAIKNQLINFFSQSGRIRNFEHDYNSGKSFIKIYEDNSLFGTKEKTLYFEHDNLISETFILKQAEIMVNNDLKLCECDGELVFKGGEKYFKGNAVIKGYISDINNIFMPNQLYKIYLKHDKKIFLKANTKGSSITCIIPTKDKCFFKILGDIQYVKHKGFNLVLDNLYELHIAGSRKKGFRGHIAHKNLSNIADIYIYHDGSTVKNLSIKNFSSPLLEGNIMMNNNNLYISGKKFFYDPTVCSLSTYIDVKNCFYRMMGKVLHLENFKGRLVIDDGVFTRASIKCMLDGDDIECCIMNKKYKLFICNIGNLLDKLGFTTHIPEGAIQINCNEKDGKYVGHMNASGIVFKDLTWISNLFPEVSFAGVDMQADFLYTQGKLLSLSNAIAKGSFDLVKFDIDIVKDHIIGKIFTDSEKLEIVGSIKNPRITSAIYKDEDFLQEHF